MSLFSLCSIYENIYLCVYAFVTVSVCVCVSVRESVYIFVVFDFLIPSQCLDSLFFSLSVCLPAYICIYICINECGHITSSTEMFSLTYSMPITDSGVGPSESLLMAMALALERRFRK